MLISNTPCCKNTLHSFCCVHVLQNNESAGKHSLSCKLSQFWLALLLHHHAYNLPYKFDNGSSPDNNYKKSECEVHTQCFKIAGPNFQFMQIQTSCMGSNLNTGVA